MTTESVEDMAESDDLDAEALDQDGTADTEAEVDDVDSDDEGDDEEGSVEETETKALDELEAEELEMLTDDESTETIVVDEAAEMRAIRRAELSMEGDSADEASSDEFVCTSCFLVKRTSQLANKRKKVCADCAG